jgi:hypothetical protein
MHSPDINDNALYAKRVSVRAAEEAHVASDGHGTVEGAATGDAERLDCSRKRV